MTQTKSYFKDNEFFALYKNAIARIKIPAILYCLLSLLLFPVQYIASLQNYQERIDRGVTPIIEYSTIYMTEMAFLYFALIIGCAILCTVMVNSFMHNKKAVDMFHSLPIKREKLFTTNILAVLTVLLVPMAVSYGMVAITNLKNTLASPQAVMEEFLNVAILTILIVSIAAFCSAACNDWLDSIIFSVAFNVMLPSVYFLYNLMLANYFWGFTETNIMQNVVKLCPALTMISGIYERETYLGSVFSYSAICIIAAIVIFCLANLVYKKRKIEIAQSGETQRVIYQFIIIAASVGAGLLLSTIQYRNASGFFKSVIMASLYSSTIYYSFNALLSRSFKPNKKAITYIALSAICPFLISFSMYSDIFGFEKFVPNMSDIKSVQINYGSLDDRMIAYNSVEFQLGTRYTQPESLKLITNLHKSFIENQNLELLNTDNTQAEIQDSSQTNPIVTSESIRLEYTLKSGRKISRRYFINFTQEMLNRLHEISDLPEFKMQTEYILSENLTYDEYIAIKDGFGQNSKELKLTKQERKVLYTAMQENIKAQTLQQEQQTEGVNYSIIYIKYDSIERTVKKDFAVTKNTKNTIKALNELGLSQYAQLPENQDVKAVVLRYYSCKRRNTYININQNYFYPSFFIKQIMLTEHDRVSEYGAEQTAQIAKICKQNIPLKDRNKLYYSVIFLQKDQSLDSVMANNAEGAMYYIPCDDAPQFIIAG